MKIYTLWEPGDGSTLPWLINATDEYCIEENNGYPEDYQKTLDAHPKARELVIEVPDNAITKLFISPIVSSKPVEDR